MSLEDAWVDLADVVLPDGFDAENCAIIDQMVPRTDLGAGVFSLQLELKQTWKMPSASASEKPDAMAPFATGTSQSESSKQPSNPAPSESQSKPAPSELCVQRTAEGEALAKRPRGALQGLEDAEASLDPSTTLENLAQNIKEAFEKGLIWTASQLNPTTVAFFLRSFATVHLEKAAWEKGQAPAAALAFGKYVCKKLMTTECVHELPHLLPHLRQLRKLDNSVVTALVPFRAHPRPPAFL